jgi:hypothetical protein
MELKHIRAISFSSRLTQMQMYRPIPNLVRHLFVSV